MNTLKRIFFILTLPFWLCLGILLRHTLGEDTRFRVFSWVARNFGPTDHQCRVRD